MAYSDKDLVAMTQIAYADLDKAYNSVKKKGKYGDAVPISALEEPAKRGGGSTKSLKSLKLYQKDWKIVGTHNTNSDNGFYACVVETEPGKCVIAFRGSEEMSNMENLDDWLGSDLSLLNSIQTGQQREIDRWFASKEFQELISKYDSVSLTGHSLGGNLAEYATLVSHKYGFDQKVEQCVSFDGPGFSQEFIALHAADIKRMKDRMQHYAWSFVGNLLYHFQDADHQMNCSVSNEANELDLEEYDSATRHNTKYLDYDGNGNLIKGEKDDLSKVLGPVSRDIESGNINPSRIKKYGPVLAKIFGVVLAFSLLNQLLVWAGLDDEFYKALIGFATGVKNTIKKAKKGIKKAWDDFVDKGKSFYNFITGKKTKKKSNSSSSKKGGRKYSGNTLIEINPDILRAQAAELSSLESDLEGTFNSLLNTINNANRSLSYNIAANIYTKISGFKKSINETNHLLKEGSRAAKFAANKFESADKDIASYIGKK